MGTSIRSVLAPAAAIAIAIAWQPAMAAVFCATNEAELRAALVAIGQSNFDPAPNEIRLTRRTFFTGAQAFAVEVFGATGDTVISGGWASAGATPCDVQAPDARLSALDAQGTSAVLSVRRTSVSNNATPLIRIANLTIRNGGASNAPVGLSVANAWGSIEIDNVIVHGHRAVDSQFIRGVGIDIDARIDARLRNALVYDNVGNFIGGIPLASVLFTTVAVNGGRNWYVTNSTVVSGNAQTEAIRLQADGNFWTINNILRGRVTYSESITGNPAALPPQVRQLFNNLEALPVLNNATLLQNIGNSLVDPQYNPLTFELLPTSPLVNAGLGGQTGGISAADVYGRPRTFGSVVDVGALELQQPPTLPAAIFANGFE
ncbi:MAG: hypothetical protein MEQ07_04735 [Aquimonas sp.]|nr:hypothetical protein [Aquimonas sp.]